MKRYQSSKKTPILHDNEYVWDPGENLNSLESSFNLIERKTKKRISNVKYVLLYQIYPPNGWPADTDIIGFLNKNVKKQLQEKKIILILDGTFEGYSPIYSNHYIAKSLEFSAKKHNIDTKQIFFFTGNLKEVSSEINVIPIFNIDEGLFEHVNLDNNVNIAKKDVEKNIGDKIFLSLSRRNRYHRVLSNFMIYDTPIFSYGLISQDVVTSNFNFNSNLLSKINKTEDDIKKFKNSLPWIADENNFSINDPMNPLYNLHTKTPFSIVNETYASNENNTTFFYSEKFLKPIIAFQPMVIWGQPGINKNLSIMGYHDYSDYFDLNFDDEEDDIVRYQKLLKSISPVVEELSKMPIDQRIEWRFKNQELLQHNFDAFLQRNHATQQLNLFGKIIFRMLKSGSLIPSH